MAKAFLKSRTYTNRYRPETSTFLIGNVGDVIDLELLVDVEITYTSSITSLASVTNNDTIVRNTGSWFDDGFIVGSNVSIQLNHNTGIKNVTGTILNLTPSTMVLTSLAGDTLENGIYPDVADSNGNATVGSDTSIEGIEFIYNLISNEEAQNGGTSQSLIDATVPMLKSSGLDATNPAQVFLIPYNYRSGSTIFFSYVEGLGIASGVQSFKISVSFLIAPMYEQVTDISGTTNADFFDDTNCLTDYIDIKFLPQASNPNIKVQTDLGQTALLGNTGFFNESLNGGANNFSVVSTKFKNTAFLPYRDIQTKAVTEFEIVLNHVGNTATSEYKYGFLWTPDDSALYSQNNQPYQNNLFYVGVGDITPLTESTTPFLTSGNYRITNFGTVGLNSRFTSLTRSGDNVIIKGTFEPSTGFGSYIDSIGTNLNYVLWVSVGDDLPTLSSNRVSLVARQGELWTSTSNIESFDVSNSFLSHAQPPVQLGVSNIDSCVEDEILSRSILKIDTAEAETIEEILFTVEGFNIVTQARYTLESQSFDTTIFPLDINGIQQIDINDTRGFKMATGVDKNLIQVFRSPIDDSGTKIAYKTLYAWRPRWEDWIANSNVSNNFYDNTKLNDNLNDNWASKDDVANWKIQYNIRLKVNRAGTIINTLNSFDFNVRDYDESIIWDGAITTYDSTKTNSLFIGLDANGIRNNVLASQSNTWVEADFDLEDLGGDVGDINDYYGVIRIEEYRNGGLFAIDMLSSVLVNETSTNILLPLVGETKTKLTKISATKIRVECLVDYTRLNTSISTYKLSARIGKSDINLGKYSSQYSLKYN